MAMADLEASGSSMVRLAGVRAASQLEHEDARTPVSRITLTWAGFAKLFLVPALAGRTLPALLARS